MFDGRAEEVFEGLFTLSEGSGGERRFNAGLLGALRTILDPFMLRRSKSDAQLDLPPKTDDTLVLNMSGQQASLYASVIEGVRASVFGSSSRARNLASDVAGAVDQPHTRPADAARATRLDHGPPQEVVDLDADYALALSLAAEEEEVEGGNKSSRRGGRASARSANSLHVSRPQPGRMTRSQRTLAERASASPPSSEPEAVALSPPSPLAIVHHVATLEYCASKLKPRPGGALAVASPEVLRSLQSSFKTCSGKPAQTAATAAASDGAAAAEVKIPASISSKAAQNLFVCLRKAALHPLLLRTRYVHAPTLWSIAQVWYCVSFGGLSCVRRSNHSGLFCVFSGAVVRRCLWY
jgi:hypothetical protein